MELSLLYVDLEVLESHQDWGKETTRNTCDRPLGVFEEVWERRLVCLQS